MLLRGGAKLGVRNRDGMTALELANHFNNAQTIPVLRKYAVCVYIYIHTCVMCLCVCVCVCVCVCPFMRQGSVYGAITRVKHAKEHHGSDLDFVRFRHAASPLCLLPFPPYCSFESLALILPLREIYKHVDPFLQINALNQPSSMHVIFLHICVSVFFRVCV